MSGATWRIAREEWRALARNRAGVVATLLVVALIVVAALVSIERRSAIDSQRAAYQASVDREFDAQPDRHPHRMVHYGQFVFRPIDSLAFFDFGVDGFTGNTVFLEGHRQNSANFSEARQSSLLLRFGQLTPAFVLQTLAPLLIVFLAFSSVARERERGTLRLLLAQGIDGRRVLTGKFVGHGVVALAIAVPAFAILIGFAIVGDAAWPAVFLLILGYSAWLLLWAAAAVLVSAATRRARDALIALVGIWMVAVILLPRALPEAAAARTVLPTKIETEVALHRDLLRIGDSHNPDDPYFADFRAATLARYGVDSVEELPVQYAGLVGMEGERLTTGLYAKAAARGVALEEAQNGFVRAFGIVSPLLAIRELSMTLTGSDLVSHQDFLNQAEGFRYRFVQVLNRMQVDQIPNVNAGEDPRIDAANWQRVPRFGYVDRDAVATGSARIWGSLAVLIGWLAVLVMAAIPVARGLGEGRAMSLLQAELRLVVRSRLAAASLALLFVLSALAIWSGLANVSRTERTIARVEAAQQQDFAQVRATYGQPDGDAGYAAYYTFLLTSDRPGPLAFAAIGQRDVQPNVLRIRALGLQQQLYESEAINAELALPGAFDFAFVAIYLTPLVAIALAHDLVSGEREAGRLRLLMSMPGSTGSVWRRRAGCAMCWSLPHCWCRWPSRCWRSVRRCSAGWA